jgi:hypothetical protein
MWNWRRLGGERLYIVGGRPHARAKVDTENRVHLHEKSKNATYTLKMPFIYLYEIPKVITGLMPTVCNPVFYLQIEGAEMQHCCTSKTA